MDGSLKFCSHCGAAVVTKVPPGDHLPRFVCDACGTVHYKNPLLVLGCVPEWEGRILLCRRAIEPRLGFWTVPAGFMEIGETMQHAAQRECHEEAQADVEIGSLLAVVSVTHAAQVHVMFRARMLSPRYAAGPRASRSACSRNARSPGRTSRFRVANSRCAAISRTAPPGAKRTTSPSCSTR